MNPIYFISYIPLLISFHSLSFFFFIRVCERERVCTSCYCFLLYILYIYFTSFCSIFIRFHASTCCNFLRLRYVSSKQTKQKLYFTRRTNKELVNEKNEREICCKIRPFRVDFEHQPKRNLTELKDNHFGPAHPPFFISRAIPLIELFRFV